MDYDSPYNFLPGFRLGMFIKFVFIFGKCCMLAKRRKSNAFYGLVVGGFLHISTTKYFSKDKPHTNTFHWNKIIGYAFELD